MTQRSKVGHYDIVSELGRGGMGVVYKGFEASLGRHVAIKTLSEALANDAMVVERFFREARSMAQLNDPHIVQIYFVGEDQGQPYFAMEFVAGESLSQRLKREHRLEPFEAARVLLQVAQGLATAHDRGVIHRDIKPANLLITERGVVKVADFGIALASQDFNKKLTGTGQFVGTPGYLSPEVCLGKPVDQRSDIFALGIVFFEMLTGQTPYQDESPLGMMLEVVQAEIPDVRRINDSIDPGLSAILKHMVAKEPVDRYADCHQLIADLIALGVNAATPLTASRSQPNAVIGTVVNQPTPPEMRRPPTPVAVAVQQAAPPAVSVPPPAARVPALTVTPPRKRSSVLPWATAAGLLIAGGAGAAWYFGGSGGLVTTATADHSAAPVIAQSLSSPVQTPAPASVGASTVDTAVSTANAPADSVAAVESTRVAVQVDEPESSGASVDTAAPITSSVAIAAPGNSVAVTAEAVDAHVASMTVAASDLKQSSASGPAPRAGASASKPSPQSEAIGARLAELRDNRRDRREARANNAETSPKQMAKASTAPVSAAPVYRGPPRIMVLGFGDPAVAGIAELAIEERLSEMGLDLVDEDLTSGLSGIEEGTPDIARLMAAAARHADYVVAVRAVPTGQTELTYYGQSTTQYSTRLDIAAYDVSNRRKLGSGWSTALSFTHLNADPNTRQAISPFLSRIAQGVGARGRG